VKALPPAPFINPYGYVFVCYSGIKPGALHPVAGSAKSTGMLLPFRPMAENSSHPLHGWLLTQPRLPACGWSFYYSTKKNKWENFFQIDKAGQIH